MIAKIAVSAAVFSSDKPYDYLIPTALEPLVVPGARVQIPFGRGSRLTEGVVLALCETGMGNKFVDRVLDPEPLLDGAMLRMAAFIRERYFCTYYEALRAILPAGLWFHVKTTYRILPSAGDSVGTIHQKEALAVLQVLEALGGEATQETLRQSLSTETIEKGLKLLLIKGWIEAETDRQQRAADQTEQIAELAVTAGQAADFCLKKGKNAPKQAAVIELLRTAGSSCVKDICYYTGVKPDVIRRLEKLGLLTLRTQEVLRSVLPDTAEPPRAVRLNSEQQQAADGLLRRMEQEKPGVALLYGVTGSGKTAVYLTLIEACLKHGKTALLLVPEIALTPQLMRLFHAQFGARVAVLHSSLRVGERYDEWKRIRRGEAQVVIGTRSAIFAPLKNPGVLIVDEEQEHTYKSENAPRYHAREIAIFRGDREGALVVLGSATPSVETMYRARTGVYDLETLHGRYNGKTLPKVFVADLKKDLKSGENGAVGSELRAELEKNLETGRQSILFLNRRGSSRLLVCVDCGDVPMCPRCSVHLTYHAANNRLMCHYCGYSEPMEPFCPKCGGRRKQVGFGTQHVEEELHRLYPNTKVLRMDADTVSAANPHEKLLSRFRNEKIPILVGTQMVAKGLNFENVTLVGVLDADTSLYVDSFRASETTFSMITQVVGRAGRGAAEGRAVIQTVTPENPVLCLAARQDYDGFYEAELGTRQIRACPPFADLLTLTFTGAVEGEVADGAYRFREALTQTLRRFQEPVRILGPAPASVAKVNEVYRYRLTLSCRNTRGIRSLLAEQIKLFQKDRQNRGLNVFADVNAYYE